MLLSISFLWSPSMATFWEVVEAITIVLVTLGCAGEVWAEHHEFAEDPSSLMPTEHVKKKWELFFGCVVFISLAVEFFAFGLSLIGASIESSHSKREIANLQSTNLLFEQSIETLKQENLASQSNAVALEKQLIEAKIKLAKIDEHTRPMHIPDNRRAYGTNLLSKFGGTQVDIVATSDDGNASIFGDELGAFLKDATWNFTGTSKGFFSGTMKTGVVIRLSRKEDIRAAVTLETFLNDSGIPCTTLNPEKWTNWIMSIAILKKP
jgi:hypothetical protein